MVNIIRRLSFCGNDSFASYLSGYSDAEGCFCISFSKSSRHKLGWEVRPSFSVSQNGDRAEILYAFKKYVGCGFIRPDRSDKTLKFEVRSLRDLIQKIIPHFEKYPILSSKRKDYELFTLICEMMYQKKHLDKKGLKLIIRLACQMNCSGKRKFLEDEMKV